MGRSAQSVPASMHVAPQVGPRHLSAAVGAHHPGTVALVLVAEPAVPKEPAVAQARKLEPLRRLLPGMVHAHMGCQVGISGIWAPVTVRAPCMEAVFGDLVCVLVSAAALAVWKCRHGRSVVA